MTRTTSACVLAVLAIALSACSPGAKAVPGTEAAPAATSKVTAATSTVAPTNTAVGTEAPTLGTGSISTRTADGMKMSYVPAGEFTMGSDAGTPAERPAHTVSLDAFWIDQTEVTNGMYRLCVEAGACQPPLAKSSFKRHSYYGDPQYDAYPVITVDWDSARAYCAWAGARLPSEAEWEKAARGTDGRTYPSGDTTSCSVANTNGCQGDTSAAGNYAAGVSPFGVYDMAGNVLEWTADWYDAKYYSVSPSSNPRGPTTGQFRVARGGSWYDFAQAATMTARFKLAPADSLNYVGFRCASEASAGQVASTAPVAGAPTPGTAGEASTITPGAAGDTSPACDRADITYGQSLWDQAAEGAFVGGRWREFWFCGAKDDVVDIRVVSKMQPLDAQGVRLCLKTTFGLNRLQIYDSTSAEPLVQGEKMGSDARLTGYKLPHGGAFRIFMSYFGNGVECHGVVITINKR